MSRLRILATSALLATLSATGAEPPVAALPAAPAASTLTAEGPGAGFHLSSTDHLIFSNAKDPDDPGASPTNVLMHENTLRGDYAQYSLGINFTNRFTTDGPKDIVAPFTLEKKTLTAEWDDWKVELGDSHQELGRGIALALYRDPVFGIDNTLEGASVRFHPSGLDMQGFIGRVNALRAPVAVNPAVVTALVGNEIYMTGGQFRANVTQDVKAGGHYLLSTNRPLSSLRFDKRWHTGGAVVAVDNIVDGLDFYGESNLLVTQLLTELIPDPANGYASYGSITWSQAQWKTKLEVKDYRNFLYDLRRPPTLEDDVVITQNTSDVSAARLWLEHRFEETRTSVYASYMGGEDREAFHSPLHHGLIGTKFQALGRNEFELKGGYRTLPGKERLSHAGLKTKWHTARGQALEVEGRVYRRDYNLRFSPTLDDRYQLFLTYTFSERFNASLGYELVPTNPESAGRNFANAGATYKTGGLTAKAFVGQTSGGVLCSGGVCRQVPAYTGAMLETTYVF